MDDQRLDKWLWCARFYKTRGLAVDAIKAGRAMVNGQLAKPAKGIAVGDTLVLRQPPHEITLIVLSLAKQRLGATEARKLYNESADSIAARERLQELLRISNVIDDPRGGKLTKKERRDREAFKRGNWSEQ